ncbi:MAG: hypothetical protein KKH83_08130, partial [Candidatus Margulisbacteria bacterium]|nr:hypothetical protein [Candidatus Margulisiibacteriota bacterium]
MDDRERFAKKISSLGLTRVQQALALLWFYRNNQFFEERTASELATDLHDLGFGRPNVTTLHRELAKSRMTVKGKRKKTFQVHMKSVNELDKEYSSLLSTRAVEISPSVIPFDFVQGTRPYLEQIVRQINGAYDYGWYDCCSV